MSHNRIVRVHTSFHNKQLFWLLYLTMNQKQCVKSNSTWKYVPLWYAKYPVLSPTFSKDVALTNFWGTLHSPLWLRGKAALKTFSALDTIGWFNLTSQDNSSWLDLAWANCCSWRRARNRLLICARLRLASLHCSRSLVQTTAHCVSLSQVGDK